MAFKMAGTVTGLKALFDELKDLPRRLQTKTLKGALSAAGRRVTYSARAKVSVRTGQLKKSIGHREKVYRNSGKVVSVVGPRGDFRTEMTLNGKLQTVNPQKYSHLVELGGNFGGGRKPGRGGVAVAAKPFLRPALAENVGATKDLIAEAVRKAIAGK